MKENKLIVLQVKTDLLQLTITERGRSAGRRQMTKRSGFALWHRTHASITIFLQAARKAGIGRLDQQFCLYGDFDVDHANSFALVNAGGE